MTKVPAWERQAKETAGGRGEALRWISTKGGSRLDFLNMMCLVYASQGLLGRCQELTVGGRDPQGSGGCSDT